MPPPTLAMLALAAATILSSPVMVVALWLDKRRATRGQWRISERTLHTIEACGGWAASLLARRALRHKSRKARYRLVAGAIAAAHVALWLLLIAWSAGVL